MVLFLTAFIMKNREKVIKTRRTKEIFLKKNKKSLKHSFLVEKRFSKATEKLKFPVFNSKTSKLNAHKHQLSRNRNIISGEVEYIRETKTINKVLHYNVKLKNWPVEASFWVPKSEVCKLGFTRQIKSFNDDKNNNTNESYIRKKKTQRAQLDFEEKRINSLTEGFPYIAIENEVDLD